MINKLIAILFIAIIPFNALAEECDFSTGVTKLPDGAYRYEKICHQKVGLLVQQLGDRDAQVQALNHVIELKDLALDAQTKRADMWKDTSLDLEGKFTSIEKYQSTNNLIYFGLGFLVTGLAVYGASQLRR